MTQYDRARAHFDDALDRANHGDIPALRELDQATDDLLDVGRDDVRTAASQSTYLPVAALLQQKIERVREYRAREHEAWITAHGASIDRSAETAHIKAYWTVRWEHGSAHGETLEEALDRAMQITAVRSGEHLRRSTFV